MSPSAKDSSQDNTSHANHRSSNDSLKSPEDWNTSREHNTAPDNSLVEHILDFLDKYPSCFATP